jgi:hypothetical protein
MGIGWNASALIAGIMDLLATNQLEQIISIISRKSDSWIGGLMALMALMSIPLTDPD